MAKNFQGRFYKLVRAVVRPIFPIKTIACINKIITPACYVAHYKNSSGPLLSMLYLPVPVHPWALSVFCTVKGCYRQYMSYTFTKRFGWPRFLAAPLCALLSCIIAPLYQSMGAIPVYRGSTQIRNTLSKSLHALYQGENIIIFPDVDYQSTDDETKEIYRGFLNLEKFYFHQKNCHLPFIPVYVDEKSKHMEIGDSVQFTGELSFSKEKELVANQLIVAMNQKINQKNELS